MSGQILGDLILGDATNQPANRRGITGQRSAGLQQPAALRHQAIHRFKLTIELCQASVDLRDYTPSPTITRAGHDPVSMTANLTPPTLLVK